MEEILASIRKIISEDGATVQPAETAPADDVLELTQEVPMEMAAVEEPSAVPVVEMEDTPPPAPQMPEPEVEQVMAPPEPVYAPIPDNDMDRLISDTTAQASASALHSLAGMVRGSGNGIQSFPLGNGAATLEAMVVDFMRPYLKAWLDQNLPTLVERIVQKEIQKITRDMN